MPIIVGCSGYDYDWRIYKTKDRLGEYSNVFPAVEINNTFYRTPKKENTARMATKVSNDFVFTIKVNRTITNKNKLLDLAFLRRYWADFKQGAKPIVGPHTVFLFQFPPTLKYDVKMLQNIKKIVGKSQIAIEPRHDSWFTPEVLHQIIKRGFLPVMTSIPRSDIPGDIYIRLHGEHYAGHYTDEFLRKLAKYCLGRRQKTYVFFNNTDDGAAPIDCLKLLKYIKQKQ